ncbi:MAG: hypothetical protein V1644_00450, partial [Candidatus Micrarchaeota archaeon]
GRLGLELEITLELEKKKWWHGLPILNRNRIPIQLSREQIERLRDIRQRFPRQKSLKDAIILVNEQKKTVKLLTFYPLAEGSVRKELLPTGSGIGSKVYHALIEYLADNFKGHTIMPSVYSPHATAAFEKAGENPYIIRPIEEHRDIVRAYMTKRFGMRFEGK